MSFLYLHIYLSQVDICLQTFSLDIASINHNRKADLRVKNYKSIIVTYIFYSNFPEFKFCVILINQLSDELIDVNIEIEVKKEQ